MVYIVITRHEDELVDYQYCEKSRYGNESHTIVAMQPRRLAPVKL